MLSILFFVLDFIIVVGFFLVVLYAFLSGQYSCHLTVCFGVVVCPRPHLYIFFNRHPLSVYLSTLCTQNHHHPPPPLRSYTPPPFKCVISQPNFSLIRFYGKRRKQNMWDNKNKWKFAKRCVVCDVQSSKTVGNGLMIVFFISCYTIPNQCNKGRIRKYIIKHLTYNSIQILRQLFNR